MRKARLKAPADARTAFYHCVSRVVDKEFRLGEEEVKEKFVELMREYERFCGVKVVTYCVMSNHFHILLEVPERPREPLGDKAVVELLRGLSGMTEAGTVEQQLGWFRERGQPDAAEALKARVTARMWDVSGFMKSLKGRFTQWYNRRHGRKGTLWEERFKSVLVEGSGTTLAAMAAYIDLNPVRAGLVEDPKDYRWCGYGEALGGAGWGGVADGDAGGEGNGGDAGRSLEGLSGVVVRAGRRKRGDASGWKSDSPGNGTGGSGGGGAGQRAIAAHGVPAVAGEVFYGRGRAGDARVRERDVYHVPGAVWGQTQGRSTAPALRGSEGGSVLFAEPAGADHRAVSGPEKRGRSRSGQSVRTPFAAGMRENGRWVHCRTKNPRPAVSPPRVLHG